MVCAYAQAGNMRLRNTLSEGDLRGNAKERFSKSGAAIVS